MSHESTPVASVENDCKGTVHPKIKNIIFVAVGASRVTMTDPNENI